MPISYSYDQGTCAGTSSCSVWSNWNGTLVSSSTTSSQVWYNWNSNTTATTAVTGSNTWSQWNTVYYTTESIYSTEQTEEQIKQSKEYAERIAKEREEQIAKQKQIEETARQLLKEVLTDEQNEQFDKENYFELTSVKSGSVYRITKGRSRNVYLLDKDKKKIKTLCFHPQEQVHDYDTMVAQKLMLESCEDEVRKVANYT